MVQRFAKTLCLLAMVLLLTVPCSVQAQEGSLWQNTTEIQSENAEAESSLRNAADGTSGSTVSGIEREKQYLLEALCELEDMGLSPVKIWSDITKDQRVVERMDSAKEAVTETVTQKVSEVSDAAVDAVEETVTKETEKVKNSLLEMIREQIAEFFSGIFG